MRFSKFLPPSVLLLVLASSLPLVGHQAQAARSVGRGVHLAVGQPQGACPMEACGPARAHRVESLPSVPSIIWSRRVGSGAKMPVVSDQHGRLVLAASSSLLIQLDDTGKSLWETRTGDSMPASGPVVLSNGTRVLITVSGMAWGIGEKGEVLFVRKIPGASSVGHANPLPTSRGTFVLALGRELLEFDSSGSLVDRVSLPVSVVGSILHVPAGILAMGASGSVYLWPQPLAPKLIGSFGGSVYEGAVGVDSRRIVAVVDMDRLVEMDLQTGQTLVRHRDLGLVGPPTVGHDGRMLLFRGSNALVLRGPDGALSSFEVGPPQDASRATPVPVPEDPLAMIKEPTGADRRESRVFGEVHTPPLIDRKGRIAFVLRSGVVGVLDQGERRDATRRVCKDSVGLTAVSKDKFAVTCASGEVFVLGEASTTTSR